MSFRKNKNIVRKKTVNKWPFIVEVIDICCTWICLTNDHVFVFSMFKFNSNCYLGLVAVDRNFCSPSQLVRNKYLIFLQLLSTYMPPIARILRQFPEYYFGVYVKLQARYACIRVHFWNFWASHISYIAGIPSTDLLVFVSLGNSNQLDVQHKYQSSSGSYKKDRWPLNNASFIHKTLSKPGSSMNDCLICSSQIFYIGVWMILESNFIR